MSVESGPSPQSEFASLQSCFVEGSPEQRARERRIRRRALIISVCAQAAMLTAIILVPLFGKPERIALANMVPIPPYTVPRAVAHHDATTRPIPNSHRNFCAKCYSPNFPDHPDTKADPEAEPPGPDMPSVPGAVPCVAGCIPMTDLRPQPARPADPVTQTPRRIKVTSLEPAMLTHRVEPQYPTLMRQIHRAGRVELRAIIATDGTIKSLEVVNGDPGFIQSALDAVTQWRYRPTILNGQAVEIDTFVTVVYSLQQ